MNETKFPETKVSCQRERERERERQSLTVYYRGEDDDDDDDDDDEGGDLEIIHREILYVYTRI